MQQNLDKLVILLSSSIAQRKLYFADHPKFRDSGQEFTKLLQEILAEMQQNALFIGAVENKLVYNGRYLVGPSIAGRQLVDFMQNMHSGGIAFDRYTTVEEYQALLGVAAELKEPTLNLEESRELLQARGITNIEIATHYSDPVGLTAEEDQDVWQGRETGGGYLQSPILVYQALFDVVTNAHGNAAFDRKLDIDGARSVSEHLLHSTRASFTDMMQLVYYPDHDSYTVGHSVRVATLAVYVGDQLGLDMEQLLELGAAGLLHDVGKSKIPDEILFKPGRLNEDEYRVMKTHARLGAEILLEHRNITPMDVAAAWGHHIRHDGGGYPEKPPWAVRNKVTALLQVCDVFEALTAIRPYKPPMTPQTAYDIMLKDEGAFDPAIFSAFVAAMGLYPPGNHIRLSDGSLATVVAAGTDIEKPQVRLTRSAAGHPLGENDQLIIDLANTPDQLVVRELLLEPVEEPVS